MYLHPEGRGETAGSNAPGAFLVFLVVTCPRPPVFARPKRYSSCLSLHSQGLFNILSDRNIFYTPQGGRTTAGSNAPGAFLFFFFWCSLAPDLWFSLGQTNTRRVFRYTGKGFYLE